LLKKTSKSSIIFAFLPKLRGFEPTKKLFLTNLSSIIPLKNLNGILKG
jgi:flagellar assembly factor FliW